MIANIKCTHPLNPSRYAKASRDRLSLSAERNFLPSLVKLRKEGES